MTDIATPDHATAFVPDSAELIRTDTQPVPELPTRTVWTTRFAGGVIVHTSRDDMLAAVREYVQECNLGRPFDGDDDELLEYATDVVAVDIAEHEVAADADTVWTTRHGDDVDVHDTHAEAIAELRRYVSSYTHLDADEMSDDELVAWIDDADPERYDFDLEARPITAG